jgi:carbonic anhydrase/acetyltransferase-like protein (isoleucine patch superfamily)
MGASVAGDAILEPGSVVEMGASIGSQATVKAGAKVRWGASVAAGAVIEEGAVINWGASVGKEAVVGREAVVQWGASVSSGAVVGPRAVIGAGASVLKGARVQAGAHFWPGTTAAATRLAASPPGAALPVSDERTAKIDAVCDKLQSELDAAPTVARDFLGAQINALQALRGTCHDLVRRELAIRGEASPAQMERLEKEYAQIRGRLDTEKDSAVRTSLQAALEAIDAQKAERLKLSSAADRLDAEQTRLLFTLESVSTQLFRLRTASSSSASQPELASSLSQLNREIDAIADALEEVARPELTSAVVPVSQESGDPAAHRARHRE